MSFLFPCPFLPPFSTYYARRVDPFDLLFATRAIISRGAIIFSLRFVLHAVVVVVVVVVVSLSLRSLSSENSLYLANEFKDIRERRVWVRVFDVNGRRNRFSSTFSLLLAIAWSKCASWTHWEIDRRSLYAKSPFPLYSLAVEYPAFDPPFSIEIAMLEMPCSILLLFSHAWRTR